MDATIDPAVGNLYGSCAEGGVAAGLQNLVGVLTANGECNVVSAKVPACASYVSAAHSCWYTCLPGRVDMHTSCQMAATSTPEGDAWAGA